MEDFISFGASRREEGNYDGHSCTRVMCQVTEEVDLEADLDCIVLKSYALARQTPTCPIESTSDDQWHVLLDAQPVTC